MMKTIIAILAFALLLSSALGATTKPCFSSTQGCATVRCGFNTSCVEDLTTCTFACKTCAERNLGCATVRCPGTPCTEEPGTCIPTCSIPTTPNPTPTPLSKVTLCPNGSPQAVVTAATEQDACRRAGCTSTETCIYNTCPNFPILNTPAGVATCVKRACQEELQGNKVYCGAAPANIWDQSGKCPFRICYGPGTCSGGVIDYDLPFPCAPMNDWESERRCTNFDGSAVAVGSQIPKLVESTDATGVVTWKPDRVNVCICQSGVDGPPPRLVCSQAPVVVPTTKVPTTRAPTTPPDACATVDPCIFSSCLTGTTCEKEVRNGQCEAICKPITCSVLRGTGNCPVGTACVSGPCPGGLICIDPPGTCQPTEPQTCADRFQGCSRVRCDTGLICQEDPNTCAVKCVETCPSNWISGANQCGRQCAAPAQTCLSHLINQERAHRADESVNKYCNLCAKSTLCALPSVAQSFRMTTLRTATKKDVITTLNELATSFLKGSPANTFQLSSNQINVVSTSSRGTVWSVKVFFRNAKCDVKLFWADKYKDALFQQRGITSTVSTQDVQATIPFEITQEDASAFTTEAATLITQTCIDGSEISAEQTCPVEEMIVPASSSSSSTSVAAIVGAIVAGVVLLTLIIAAFIIMRRRRHANTIKSIAQETQMTGSISEQRV